MAYVAKDATYARACHVLECGGGLAQDVLTTVGQAFELRFKVGRFRSLGDAHNTIRTFVFRRDRVLSGPETAAYTRSKVTGLRVKGGPKRGAPELLLSRGPKSCLRPCVLNVFYTLDLVDLTSHFWLVAGLYFVA